MPIRIPDALPATAALERENIFVMTEYRALHQDIRPLKVALLNLMPTKVATETQIMRKLSNTPLQVEITLVRIASHDPKNVAREHLESFYRTFDEIKGEHFDGMIITGAPVETLPFDQVDYWTELCEIMQWTQGNVHSTLHICWGAQAAAFFHYGLDKHALARKLSGIYEHHLVKPTSPWVRGFDDVFFAPHSRFTATRLEDIEATPGLEIVASSDEAGAYLVKSTDSRRFFVFGHPEYDRNTLADEFERDRRTGGNPNLPANYFPNNDPARAPLSRWRAHAQLLYTNWLNYYVYQTTPYDIVQAGAVKTPRESNPQDEARTMEGMLESDGDTAGRMRTPASGGASATACRLAPKQKPECKALSPFMRAETEDDDGYDPYSDRPAEQPLFERDPWR